MLKRAFRLRRANDLNKVYKFGKKSSAPNLYIKARHTNLPVSRLAVVVTKKVSKKATLRNRMKRQMSEVVRTNWQQIKPGFDIIVMITADTTKQKPSQTKAEALEALKKLAIIDKS
ncbi:ribonuclease P protein component [Candidatus Saccharibacteria bacterium]|nr:ribonuclease P protein component [Candidatus Saccharibacteria bacterium]